MTLPPLPSVRGTNLPPWCVLLLHLCNTCPSPPRQPGAPCVHARRFRFCCVSLWVGFRWSGSVSAINPLLHVYYVFMFASILWLDFFFGSLGAVRRHAFASSLPSRSACMRRVHMPCATDAPWMDFIISLRKAVAERRPSVCDEREMLRNRAC